MEVGDLSIERIKGDFEVAFLDEGTVCATALNVAVLGVVVMRDGAGVRHRRFLPVRLCVCGRLALWPLRSDIFVTARREQLVITS